MNEWKFYFLIAFAFINIFLFFVGYYKCKFHKQQYAITPWLTPIGIIAWGDAIFFCPFWVFTALISVFFQDWNLFLVIFSIFWVVRSLGEVNYWFNQQFSTKVYKWNEPKNLFWYKLFKDDFVWCAYQVAWQCVAIISIVASIYFVHQWLNTSDTILVAISNLSLNPTFSS